jgi:hypothetical protein
MEGEGWRRSATDWGIRNIIDEPIEGGFYAEIEEYPISQVDIKYLHQLQNLFFALTGEELEVNL